VRTVPQNLFGHHVLSEAEIYGVGSNVQKGHVYKASIAQTGATSTFSTIDKVVHSRKRRILAPAFTEAALGAMEKYMLDHICTFIDIVSGAHGGQGDGWSGDMALWCNYLAFDVMGDLAFNKQFNMLTESTTRSITNIIDNNVHRQAIVSIFLSNS
jgi:cytochrome P450